MNRKQQKIVTELRDAFSDVKVASFEVVDQSEFTGKVLVFMAVVPYSCQGDYLRNQFEIGPRGGLKVIKQEFKANY